MKRLQSSNIVYPGSHIRRKKKSMSPSPLILLIIGFFALLILFLFFPVHEALMHKDLIASQSPLASALPTNAVSPQATVYISATPTKTPQIFPILVNAQNPIPDNYDLSGLISLNDIETGLFTVNAPNIMVDECCLKPLLNMFTAAHDDGITVWQISEGYRSVGAQQQIWDEKYQKYRNINGLSESKAQEAVARRVARPGYSEHHTGLALDITVPGESFRLTKQAKWISDHCHEYGFIIRYTEEKEYLTGITAEPWHIRYVGPEAASVMKENNWCLEEYTQKFRK